MVRPSFSKQYCARHGLAPEAYAPAVFRHALYPHTRLLASLIRGLDDDYFAADLDLVQAAGRLHDPRDFDMEAEEFRHHPANHGFLRRVLRLRVSVGRLRAFVRETLPRTGRAGTTETGAEPPFFTP